MPDPLPIRRERIAAILASEGLIDAAAENTARLDAMYPPSRLSSFRLPDPGAEEGAPDALIALRARRDRVWQARLRAEGASIFAPRRTAHVVSTAPARLGSTPYGEAVLSRAVGDIRGLPDGGRNQEIARIAYMVGGYAAGGEIDPVEGENEVVSAANAVGSPTGDGRHMADTARRCFRAGAEAPIAPDPPVSRPVDTVPRRGRLRPPLRPPLR